MLRKISFFFGNIQKKSYLCNRKQEEMLIFDIKRYAVNDGPGIRTTLFMKGCPLRCAWCHNPESWTPQPQLLYKQSKCIGCQTCIAACQQQALRLTPDGIARDEHRRMWSHYNPEGWPMTAPSEARQQHCADQLQAHGLRVVIGG
jgi:pyruvate formate lyase activating enzyme